MAQKVVLKVISMTDDKVKQKAIEAAADIYGVDSIAAKLETRELVVAGEMDAVAVVKKLKKVTGMVDIVTIGPAGTEEPPSPPDPEKRKKKKKKQDNKDEANKKERKHDEERNKWSSIND